MKTAQHYLMFGDVHGRILPAFRLASAWSRDHETPVAALLQVGDLGFFPDPTRLDKATKRHAEKDPSELGARFLVSPNVEADAVFADPCVPEGIWFTAGNHEDFEALAGLERKAGPRADAFVVDVFDRVLCVRDGHTAAVPGGLEVGALWGIDFAAPNARRKTIPAARIRPQSATELAARRFDVLLTHDGPRDAVLRDCGSMDIGAVISLAQPSFAFFGHYGERFGEIAGDFGRTRVFNLAGMEMHGPGGCAEEGSVGVLRWEAGAGEFEYLDPEWLATFTRANLRHR